MAKHNNLTDFLTDVASAIKDKRGTGEKINAQDFASEVRAIEPLLDTLDISGNGLHNVKDYKNVSVFVESNDFEKIKSLLSGWTSSSKFEVPYGITELGNAVLNSASSNYKSPSTLYLPSTITLFKNVCIGGDTRHIYYNGTLEDWGKIEKGVPSTSGDHAVYYSTSNQAPYIYFNENNEVGDFTLNENTTEIKMGAFSQTSVNQSNPSKYSFYIPKSVKILNTGAFYCLKGFKKIEFEEGSEISFGTNKYGTSSDQSMFAYSTAEEIILPNMPYISRYMFRGASIKKINLPSTITKINEGAFNSCYNLKELTIPSSVSEIGNSAFASMGGNIVMESSTPCIITSSTFSSFSKKIYVPKGSRETFISATNWSSQASKIYEKYVVVFNVPNDLLNNESITYSTDGGKTYQQFTNSVLSLNEVANIKIKSTDSSQTILIGTSAGSNDVGTISNSELTFSFTTDTNVYLTIQ